MESVDLIDMLRSRAGQEDGEHAAIMCLETNVVDVWYGHAQPISYLFNPLPTRVQ